MAGMLSDLSDKTPLEIISDLTNFDGYKHKFILMVNTVPVHDLAVHLQAQSWPWSCPIYINDQHLVHCVN